MERRKLERLVIDVVSDNLVSHPIDITTEHSLNSDLSCDSLDLVEIVMELESMLNIEIPDVTLETGGRDMTISKLVDIVQQRMTT